MGLLVTSCRWACRKRHQTDGGFRPGGQRTPAVYAVSSLLPLGLNRSARSIMSCSNSSSAAVHQFGQLLGRPLVRRRVSHTCVLPNRPADRNSHQHRRPDNRCGWIGHPSKAPSPKVPPAAATTRIAPQAEKAARLGRLSLGRSAGVLYNGQDLLADGCGRVGPRPGNHSQLGLELTDFANPSAALCCSFRRRRGLPRLLKPGLKLGL